MYIGTVSYLLLLIIKVLFVVFIIGLVAGVIVWIKNNNLFTEEDVKTIKGAFITTKVVEIKELCSACTKELNSGWKVCPHCGTDK